MADPAWYPPRDGPASVWAGPFSPLDHSAKKADIKEGFAEPQMEKDMELNLRDDLDDARVIAPVQAAPTYSQPCSKCRGSGRFHSYSGRLVGQCFICKGTGTHTFKTSPEHRAKRRVASAKAALTRRANVAAKAVSWIEANPEIVAWLQRASARGFNFATSLSQALAQYGHLTENQMAAARKCMAKDAELPRPEKRPDGFPTRADMQSWSPAEHAIFEAQQQVDACGGSVAITAATILLSKARDCVADHMEGNGHYDRRAA